MPKITALVHAANDAPRLGRTLESLRPCDELLVVLHTSQDATAEVAREHGASIVPAVPGVEGGAYAVDASHDWILCLLPSEALSEALEASLHEWKESEPDESIGFACAIREETESGWRTLPAETRLVYRRDPAWSSALPPDPPVIETLPGELLRFRNP